MRGEILFVYLSRENVHTQHKNWAQQISNSGRSRLWEAGANPFFIFYFLNLESLGSQIYFTACSRPKSIEGDNRFLGTMWVYIIDVRLCLGVMWKTSISVFKSTVTVDLRQGVVKKAPIPFRAQSDHPVCCYGKSVERTYEIAYPLISSFRSTGFL